MPYKGDEDCTVSLRRRLFAALCLRYFFGYCGVAALGAGAFVLVWRLWGKDLAFGWTALVVGALLLLSMCVAVVRACRNLPSRESLVAWLDDKWACGGLLMAAMAEDIGGWRGHLPNMALPGLHVDLRREIVTLVCGCLFCALGALIPANSAVSEAARRLDIKDETSKLEENLKFAEEESVIPAEKIEELRSLLKNIEEQGYAGDSAKTYELLDVLEEKIVQEFAKAENSLADSALAMDKLAEALDMLEKAMDDALAGTAVEELSKLLADLAAKDPEFAKMLEKLAQDNPMLSKSFSDSMANMKKLTPEEQKKLAELLRDNADRIKDLLRKMAENHAKGNGQGNLNSDSKAMDAETLAEWLNANCPDGSCLAAIAGSLNGANGGKGGNARGRGDAPLNMTGQSQIINTPREKIALDGQALPDETSVLRRTVVKPNTGDANSESAKAGTLTTGRADAKARERTVHPQHRRAVREFFE